MTPPHRWSPVCRPPRGLVRPVPLDPDGRTGPTRGQARSGRWRRTSHGFYVPTSVDGSVPEQRILEQSVRAPDGGGVTGWAACRLHGAAFFDGVAPDGRTLLPVPIATDGRNVRGDAQVQLVRDRLGGDRVVFRQGVLCVEERRGLLDAMRSADDEREATVAMDMMAAASRLSIARMRRFAAAHPGLRGLPQVMVALDLASEDSRSPAETRMRLVWVLDAGLPPPEVNRAVFDLDGRLLGYADLLDTEAGVVGEYDGADHRSAGRHSDDVGREDRFRRHGLEMFRVTGPDRGHPDRIVERMHGARARALWEAPSRRRWTTVPPPWWEVGLDLDELLDQRDALRALHEHEATG